MNSIDYLNKTVDVKIDWPLGSKRPKHGFIYPINYWYRQDNKLFGNKEFLIQDPDGYLIRFSEDLGEKETSIS